MSTLTTLIIRHIAGSKKGEVEKFPVTTRIDLRVGRGPNNDVSFDPAKEDTISREHCRIVQDEVNADEYLVIDCQSKNGTYVNDHLITEKAKVTAGDIIKLGKEGPVIEFDLDPRPVKLPADVLEVVNDTLSRHFGRSGAGTSDGGGSACG